MKILTPEEEAAHSRYVDECPGFLTSPLYLYAATESIHNRERRFSSAKLLNPAHRPSHVPCTDALVTNTKLVRC